MAAIPQAAPTAAPTDAAGTAFIRLLTFVACVKCRFSAITCPQRLLTSFVLFCIQGDVGALEDRDASLNIILTSESIFAQALTVWTGSAQRNWLRQWREAVGEQQRMHANSAAAATLFDAMQRRRVFHAWCTLAAHAQESSPAELLHHLVKFQLIDLLPTRSRRVERNIYISIEPQSCLCSRFCSGYMIWSHLVRPFCGIGMVCW